MNLRDRYLMLSFLGMIMLPVGVKASPNLPIENKAIVSPAIKNSVAVNEINPIILEVQRGEIVDQAIGDVDGDEKDEEVLLMGSKIVKNSHFMGELYVIIKDKKDGKIKNYIRPHNCGGYNSFLTLTDVTGNGISNVIITAPTGGSGGIVDLRVLDFSGDKAKEIFNKENNKGISFVGKYLPNYKAELTFPGINRNIVVELLGEKDLYSKFNIYDANGDVKNSGVKPYMQGFSSAIAFDVDDDGTEELLTTQRIVGPASIDTLGYVRTIWQYMAGNWQEQKIVFSTDLFAKDDYSNNIDILKPGGYLISIQDIEIANSFIKYPYVSKMGTGYQKGKLNGQIDAFIKNILSGISNGEQVTMTYEIKYAGNKYLSVLFTGIKTKNYKSSDILQAFNFDMETGESVALENLLYKKANFWTMVTKESTKKGYNLDKEAIQGFYYDGDCLVLLYKDKEAFAIDKKFLESYLRIDKTEKILTEQSEREKKSLLAKKAD